MSDHAAPYHHGDLRQALLSAAREVLERNGPASLSLRDLARQLGVSHNAPYRHFADRDALLDALSAEGFARLAEALQHVRGDTATERIAAMGQTYVAFADAHPGLFALMFQPVDATARPETVPIATRTLDLLRAGIREATGAEDSVDVATLWALVHGLSALRANAHQLFMEPAMIREVTARAAEALVQRARVTR
jgi:AcrR family transcriptional regulator